jgi:methylmalonyl-CoA mutase C-terminal domain/subunit
MKIVMAKPGLDGHDRGAKVIARSLRDGGHEVVYTGLRRTPEEISRIVMDEDVKALGLSTLSGAHDVLVPRICELLRDEGMGHVLVFLGGIIPERDHESMFSHGVRAIFGPGSRTDEILSFLDEADSRSESGAPIGVGDEDGWRWN